MRFRGRGAILEIEGRGKLVRHNVESGEKTEAGQLKEMPGSVLVWTTTSDRSRLLLATGSVVSLVELDNPGVDRRWTIEGGGLTGNLTLSPDRRLVYYCKGKLAGVSDLGVDPPSQHTYLGNHEVPLVLALSPDGKVLASADGTGKFTLWDARYFPAGKGNQILAEWTQPAGVASLTFSPDSRQLAVGNDDGTIFHYRVEVP